MKKDILEFLEEIHPTADGGYTLTDEAREFFREYLQRYSFNLDRLVTKKELLEAIGFCNAEDFRKLISKPAPAPHLRFIWNRMRQLGNT